MTNWGLLFVLSTCVRQRSVVLVLSLCISPTKVSTMLQRRLLVWLQCMVVCRIVRLIAVRLIILLDVFVDVVLRVARV